MTLPVQNSQRRDAPTPPFVEKTKDKSPYAGEASQSNTSPSPQKLSHPSDLLLQLLIEKGYLDNNADPTDKLKQIPIPNFDKKLCQRLDAFCSTERVIKFKNSQQEDREIRYTLKNLFVFLQSTTKSSRDLEIVGGSVFWLLGKNFFEQIFKVLDIDESIVPKDFLNTLEKTPNDQDLRYKTDAKTTFNTMRELRDKVIWFLATQAREYVSDEQLKKDLNDVFNFAFHKLNHCRNPHYCTLSPKDDEKTEITLIADLPREHLFTQDALRIDISKNMGGKKGYRLLTDQDTPWKPLLHRMMRLIDAENIETINHMGFPLYIYHLTKGKICLKRDFEEQLIQNFLKLAKEKEVPFTLWEATKKVYDNHFCDSNPSNDLSSKNSLPIFLVNILNTLQTHVDKDLLQKIRHTVCTLKRGKYNDEVMSHLDTLLADKAINTDFLLSFLQLSFHNASCVNKKERNPQAQEIYLREHAGKKALQANLHIGSTNVALLLNFDLSHSIGKVCETLHTLPKESQKALMQFYHQIVPETSKRMRSDILEQGKNNDVCQLLHILKDSLNNKNALPSWALDTLASLPMDENTKHEMFPHVETLPTWINEINNPIMRVQLLEFMLTIIEPKEPSNLYLEKRNSLVQVASMRDFDASTFIEAWTALLIATGVLENQKMAMSLVKKHKISSIDNLYAMLLQVRSSYAINLLELLSQDQKASVSKRFLCLEQAMNLVVEQNLISSAERVFSFLKSLLKKVKKNGKSYLTNQFGDSVVAFMQLLIDNQSHSLASEFLKSYTRNNHPFIPSTQIKSLWVQLLESETKNSDPKALHDWLEGCAYGVWSEFSNNGDSRRINAINLSLLEDLDIKNDSKAYQKVLSHINEATLDPGQRKEYRQCCERYAQSQAEKFQKRKDVEQNKASCSSNLLKAILTRNNIIRLTNLLKNGTPITEEHFKTFKWLIEEDHSELSEDEVHAFVECVIDALLKESHMDDKNAWRLSRLRVLITDHHYKSLTVSIPQLALRALRSVQSSCKNRRVSEEAIKIMNAVADRYLDCSNGSTSKEDAIEFLDLSLQFIPLQPTRTPHREKYQAVFSDKQEEICRLLTHNQNDRLTLSFLHFLCLNDLLNPTPELTQHAMTVVHGTNDQLPVCSFIIKTFLDKGAQNHPDCQKNMIGVIQDLINRHLQAKSAPTALHWIDRYQNMQTEPSVEANPLQLCWIERLISLKSFEKSFDLLKKMDIVQEDPLSDRYGNTWICLLRQMIVENSDTNQTLEVLYSCTERDITDDTSSEITQIAHSFISKLLSGSHQNDQALSLSLKIMRIHTIKDLDLWLRLYKHIVSSTNIRLKGAAWNNLVNFLNNEEIFSSCPEKETEIYLQGLRCLSETSPNHCHAILKFQKSMMKKPLTELIPSEKIDELFTILARGTLRGVDPQSSFFGPLIQSVLSSRREIELEHHIDSPLIDEYDLFFVETFIKCKNLILFREVLITLINLIVGDNIKSSHAVALYEDAMERFFHHSPDPSGACYTGVIRLLTQMTYHVTSDYEKDTNIAKLLDTLTKKERPLQLDIIASLFTVIEKNLEAYRSQFTMKQTEQKTLELLGKMTQGQSIIPALNVLRILSDNQLLSREKLAKLWGTLIVKMLSLDNKKVTRECLDSSFTFFREAFHYVYGTSAELVVTRYLFSKIFEYSDMLDEDSESSLDEWHRMFRSALSNTIHKKGYDEATTTVHKMQKRYPDQFDLLSDNHYLLPAMEYKVPQAVQFEYLMEIMGSLLQFSKQKGYTTKRIILFGMDIVRNILMDQATLKLQRTNVFHITNFFNLVFNHFRDKPGTPAEETDRNLLSIFETISFLMNEISPYARIPDPISVTYRNTIIDYHLYFIDALTKFETKNVAYCRKNMEVIKTLILRLITLTPSDKVSKEMQKMIVRYFSLPFPFCSEYDFLSHLKNCSEVIVATEGTPYFASNPAYLAEISTYLDPRSLLDAKDANYYEPSLKYTFNRLFDIDTTVSIQKAIEIFKVHSAHLHDKYPEILWNVFGNIVTRINSKTIIDEKNTLVFEHLLKVFTYPKPSQKNKLARKASFEYFVSALCETKIGEEGIKDLKAVESFIKVGVNSLLTGHQQELFKGEQASSVRLLKAIDRAMGYYAKQNEYDDKFVKNQRQLLLLISMKYWKNDKQAQEELKTLFDNLDKK